MNLYQKIIHDKLNPQEQVETKEKTALEDEDARRIWLEDPVTQAFLQSLIAEAKKFNEALVNSAIYANKEQSIAYAANFKCLEGVLKFATTGKEPK